MQDCIMHMDNKVVVSLVVSNCIAKDNNNSTKVTDH